MLRSSRAGASSVTERLTSGTPHLFRRYLDRPGDDLLGQTIDLIDHGLRNERLVVVVVHEPDSVVGQTELVDTARELVLGHLLDRVEYSDIDLLDHAGQHAARRDVELIAVHADRKLLLLLRRVEHPITGLTAGMIDDVDATRVLRQRELLALRRIRERLGLRSSVGGQHGAIGAYLLHAGLEAGLELADERDLHPAHEAELLGLGDPARDRADQDRSLVLAKAKPDEIGWSLVDALRQVVIDASELRIGKLGRELGHVVAEDEPDADDHAVPGRGALAERALAIRAVAGLDILGLDAELRFGPQHSAIGS